MNLIRNLLDEEIPICHFGTVDRKDVSMKYLELDGSKSVSYTHLFHGVP